MDEELASLNVVEAVRPHLEIALAKDCYKELLSVTCLWPSVGFTTNTSHFHLTSAKCQLPERPG